MPSPPDADDTPDVILASASPRRRALLEAAGVAFRVQPANIPEERRAGEAPHAFAERLAREKALAVAGLHATREGVRVLGSDTVVALGNEVFGKPRDEDDARRMVAALTGRTHEVITAIAVAQAGSLEVRSAVVRSRVRMRAAAAEEIEDYVRVGESMDKAGAYALQGEAGRRFVEYVDGSASSVIGLPLAETLSLLGEPLPDDLDARLGPLESLDR